MPSFANTRDALARIVAHPAKTVDERLTIELAAALGELVQELESTLEELARKLDLLTMRSG